MRRKPSDNPFLNFGDPLARGLEAAWYFVEKQPRTATGANSLVHDLAKNHVSSLNTAKWQLGDTGYMMYFDGTDYIRIPDADDLDPAALSVVMRIRADAAGYRELFDKGGNSGWRGRITPSRTLQFLDRGGTNNFTSITALTLGTYYSVMLTAGAGGIKWYLDGKADGAGGAAYGAPSTATYLDIGFGALDADWVGMIDFMLVYNRELPASVAEQFHRDPYHLIQPVQSVNLVATLAPPGTTTIRLNWTDNSEHEDGFSIERKTDAGAFAEIDTVAAGVETYDNVNVPAGHTYTYRVKATSAALGDSEYSNEAAETV